MTLAMNRKNIFTEEDRELSKDLNSDALGFTMIWRYFGQKIYKNKINSATFDIRSFNINLFNHFVIYKLEKSEHTLLKIKNKDVVEKILILLENFVIWSWYKEQNSFIKEGLLGTSNAENKWKEKSIEIKLDSKRDKLELLKRQHIYGLNGRYKGSFVNMKFFDLDYNYDETKMQEVEHLIFEDEKLKNLYDKVYSWFVKSDTVDNIPIELYLSVFGTKELAKYSKEFWLKNLAFDKGDAKIFYDLIDVKDENQELRALFTKASDKSTNDKHFRDILLIEPIMAYTEKLFEYILLLDTHDVSEVPLGYFQPIIEFNHNDLDLEDASSVALRIKDFKEIKDVSSLISYHADLMHLRDKLPWVEIKDGKIKVLMISHKDPSVYKSYLDEKKDDLESISWIHDYYKGTVRQIKGSLES